MIVNRDRELAKQVHKARLLNELTHHVGEEHAADMGDLYRRVYQREWENKINHTRALRTLITELRQEGTPIASSSRRDGGGYYLVRSGSELTDYLNRIQHRALKILAMASRIRKIGLPELLGQMQLNLEVRDDGDRENAGK